MPPRKNKKFNQSMAKDLLPSRTKSSNKTAGGKTLILAGSKGMMGAGVLAATAAARVGAGYTYLGTDLKNFSSVQHPDFLTLDIDKNIRDIGRFDSIAVGPGLGSSKKTAALIHKWIKSFIQSDVSHVVLDADALQSIAQMNLSSLPLTWILTPHTGELSRMLSVPSAVIQRTPEKYAVEAQKRWGCVVVLKGSPTLVCDDKNIFRISTGTPALAKAGTGDVLTGMIAGFLAQGIPSTLAACLAVYVHGLASQVWKKQGNDHLGLLASDLLQLILLIPKTMLKMRA